MKRFLLKHGVYILLIAFLLFIGLKAPVFFTLGNAFSILVQASITGVISMGMTYIILTGCIDLSVGSVLYLSGVCAVLTMRDIQSVPLAVLAGLSVGLLFGCINGLLVAGLNLPSMIATLGMTSLARGLGHLMVGGRSVLNMPESYKAISQGKILGISASILIFIIAFVIAYLVLYKMRFGHYIYAIGSNRDAADASGVPSRKVIFAIFAATGLLCGLGGLMMTARLGASTVDVGEGIDMACITAVALGGTSLYGGRGGVKGTLVGVLIVAAIENIMRILNVNAYLYDVIWGGVILFAVLLDTLRKSLDRKTACIPAAQS